MEMKEQSKRLAILIDAENVVPASADAIFEHAAALGTIVRREIFGAASALGAWVNPVLKYAIHPNLTIKAAKGKNSSDIALVIGAMDLLVEGGVDTVIIASSDSDFSALSVRLRNAGIDVIGMGLEKSNDLWRTACSSFVVLGNGKAASKSAAKAATPKATTQKAASTPKAAPAQKAAPKPEAAPAPAKAEGTRSAGKTAKAAAMTHEERVAVIAGQIEKRLRGHDKVQVSNLFPSLNQLAEYRVDKQDAGKKPLNYLTSTFGDLFHFEEAADGQSYVSLSEAAPVEETAPVEEAVPVEEAAPAEAKPEKKSSRSRRRSSRAKAEAPAVEPEAPAPEVAESEPAAPDPLAILVSEGIAEDVAQQIVVIFTESASLREAYNKLRSLFGNTAGRDYYNQVKDIASRQ